MAVKSKILITGSNGFIGKNLLLKICNPENSVAVIFRNKNTVKTIFNKEVKQYEGDLKDYNFVNAVIQEFKPDIVFHLAANKDRSRDIKKIDSLLYDNLIGSMNLFQSLIGLQNLKSVIILGTIDEYGNNETIFSEQTKPIPKNAYGLSKMFVTDLALFFYRTQNLPVIILRPSLAYGPMQGEEMFIPSLIKKMLKGEVFEMTQGKQKRDFIFISDLIDVLLLLTKVFKGHGEVFNIASGKSIELVSIAQLIAKKLNKLDLLKIGVLQYRKDEMMEYIVPIDKISSLINWHPKVSLEMGIDLVLDHYRNAINEE